MTICLVVVAVFSEQIALKRDNIDFNREKINVVDARVMCEESAYKTVTSRRSTDMSLATPAGSFNTGLICWLQVRSFASQTRSRVEGQVLTNTATCTLAIFYEYKTRCECFLCEYYCRGKR